MRLKERICGFIGHRSGAHLASRKDTCEIVAAQLICERCGYKTRWFDFRDAKWENCGERDK